MRLLSILSALLFLADTAAAQGPGSDTIGLWFDTESTVNVVYDPMYLQEFTGYLTLHAPSRGLIAGVECSIDFPDGVYALDLRCPPGSSAWINWGGSFENLIVTWWPAPNPDPDLIILELDFLVAAVPELPAFFTLGPTNPSSFPDEESPGYFGYTDVNYDDVYSQPLDYVFGDPNWTRLEPGAVAVESRSLTAVKSLFD